MKHSLFLFTILFSLLSSCNSKKQNPEVRTVNNPEQDTSKLYQKIKIIYGEEKKNSEEYEVYVSKKNDTFFNQWKFYKNGIIDSSKSKFYELKIEGNKGDSIFKGKLSIFSPADSIPKSKIHSRDINLSYLQKENDSFFIKEIQTDKNIIYFDYKNIENMSFVGYISDLRVINVDSLAKDDKLLVNRNYFAVDTEVSTNNHFVELLK
ncbi:hypothetical protein GZ212_15770 [Mangrovimonas sp. CR14]|uniref:hypothetical protein n=1 Tax=Mangrovimonas sp. CR14 TaxID=2706120 RepID=UPI0014227D03|nr:hypothetical protein [Mangrovimonas sp. CR14]NIK93619.1 hypothetical protein [Mangrovimonas sp. CR14]